MFRNNINDCKDQCGLFNTWNNSEKHQQGTINLHHIYAGQECGPSLLTNAVPSETEIWKILNEYRQSERMTQIAFFNAEWFLNEEGTLWLKDSLGERVPKEIFNYPRVMNIRTLKGEAEFRWLFVIAVALYRTLSPMC